MPEIDNVQIGETIAVEWGNAIRDRTIQRYANAAERDQLHPTPTEGDLSYLEDTDSIEVYDGFAWVAGIPNQAVTTAKIADEAVTAAKIATHTVTTTKIADLAVTPAKIAEGAVTGPKIAGTAISDFERSGATVETIVEVPPTDGNLAAVTLNIPTSWSSWNCVAFAHAAAIPVTNPGQMGLIIRIDGTDGPRFDYQVPGPAHDAVAAASFRSGITTTGNRTIALRGFRSAAGSINLTTVFLYARAFRTS